MEISTIVFSASINHVGLKPHIIIQVILGRYQVSQQPEKVHLTVLNLKENVHLIIQDSSISKQGCKSKLLWTQPERETTKDLNGKVWSSSMELDQPQPSWDLVLAYTWTLPMPTSAFALSATRQATSPSTRKLTWDLTPDWMTEKTFLNTWDVHYNSQDAQDNQLQPNLSSGRTNSIVKKNSMYYTVKN